MTPLLVGLALATANVSAAPSGVRALPQLLIGLEVNEQGRASECRIVASSGFSPLDEQACGLLLRRFKVSPRLINGVPASYTTTVSLRWSDEDGASR